MRLQRRSRCVLQEERKRLLKAGGNPDDVGAAAALEGAGAMSAAINHANNAGNNGADSARQKGAGGTGSKKKDGAGPKGLSEALREDAKREAAIRKAAAAEAREHLQKAKKASQKRMMEFVAAAKVCQPNQDGLGIWV